MAGNKETVPAPAETRTAHHLIDTGPASTEIKDSALAEKIRTHRFTFERRVKAQPGLTHTHRYVLMVLATHCDFHNGSPARVSIKTLAAEAEVARSTACEAVALARLGRLLYVAQRGHNTTTRAGSGDAVVSLYWPLDPLAHPDGAMVPLRPQRRHRREPTSAPADIGSEANVRADTSQRPPRHEPTSARADPTQEFSSKKLKTLRSCWS
jgi:hypothetical protein